MAIKKAQVFRAFSVLKGQVSPVTPPDWDSFLEEFMALSIHERTIDGIVYEAVDRRGVVMVAMHKPLKPDFMSQLNWADGTVTDALQDDPSELKFAYSSVACFFEPFVSVALCKGNYQNSPGKDALEVFLKRFAKPKDGGTLRVDAISDPDKRKEFLEQPGANQFKVRFDAVESLLPPETGMFPWFEKIRRAIGADLEFYVEMRIPRRARKVTNENKFRTIIAETIETPGVKIKNASAQTVMQDGTTQLLNLVSKRLQLEVHLPPEATERQSFQDLVKGLHTAVAELQENNPIFSQG